MAFARFATASLGATAFSQLVLATLYWIGGTNAVTASTVAFLAGAVPHFLVIRRWAWDRHGHLRWDAVVYTVVTLTAGALVILATTIAERQFAPMIDGRGLRTIVVVAAYVASAVPVFVLKFLVLDKVFRQANDAASSTRVRAPKPEAPGTTSS
ncbi:GtrA-like protein [Herbihabitans rhizosphaerae]|uniref:GtrA-like protein n=2 Tax=Herbihabitans rhizosphaerae TaxID=1872711 RepID=A0A4Q7L4S5_9PSEU|nr:GtrA-like protein [Herbihabitans rhizosphaerae]